MKTTLPQKAKLLFWTTGAIAIGMFLGSFLFNGTLGSAEYKKIAPVQEDKQDAAELPVSKTEKEPKYFYSIKDPDKKLKVSALSYLAGDLDTGEVILSKNQDEQFPIASVSKLITALVTAESVQPSDLASVSKTAWATYGSNGNLRVGEKIKITDLIYPLLLESSNDAGEVIAEYFGRDTFIKKMNQIATKLELVETAFADPNGLSPSNRSTVSEMFRLAGYIKEHRPELFEITTKKSYANQKHSWFSNNQFLREKGYLGGKSGYTDKALETVVSLFAVPLSETGTRNLAVVLLQSKDRFKDVRDVLEYLNQNVYYGGRADADTAWVRERTDMPEVFERDFVTLVLSGDMMLDRGVRNSINKNFNGDYSALFEKLDVLKKADITFANLEGPASDQGKDGRNLYSFRMDPSVVPALRGAGISILSVANNHVGDWGRESYLDTLVRLKENELSYTGGGINKSEAETPVIIEKYGIKIGFLGFSDVGPEWLQVGESQTGILLGNNPRLDEIVQNASQQVDHLVVSFHFGDEYKTTHNKRQAMLARRAIDAGAKIVVGHHPHVVQDTEVYKNGFIAYSLGNFIFDQSFSENTMQGLLLEVKLWKDGAMSVKKNTVKLNQFFQPDKIISGKEEKIKFEE